MKFSWKSKTSRKSAVVDAAIEINQSWEQQHFDAIFNASRTPSIARKGPVVVPHVDVDAIVERALAKYGNLSMWASDRLIDNFRSDVLSEAYELSKAVLRLHGDLERRQTEVRLFWLAAVIMGLGPDEIDWVGSTLDVDVAPWIPDVVFELVQIEEQVEDGEVVDTDYTGYGPYAFEFARDQLQIIDEEHGNIHEWGVREWDRMSYDDRWSDVPALVPAEEWLAEHRDPDSGPVGSNRQIDTSTDDDDGFPGGWDDMEDVNATIGTMNPVTDDDDDDPNAFVKFDPTKEPGFVRCWTRVKESGLVCGGCPLYTYCPAMTVEPAVWGNTSIPVPTTQPDPQISVQGGDYRDDDLNFGSCSICGRPTTYRKIYGDDHVVSWCGCGLKGDMTVTARDKACWGRG